MYVIYHVSKHISRLFALSLFNDYYAVILYLLWKILLVMILFINVNFAFGMPVSNVESLSIRFYALDYVLLILAHSSVLNVGTRI